MYHVEINNKGGFAFEVKSNGYEFNINPKGEGISPSATLLASLGSCIGVYIRKYAKDTNINLGEFSITVEAEFTKDKPISFKTINISVDLKNNDIDERRKKAMSIFAKSCPIHNTLKVDPEVKIEVI